MCSGLMAFFNTPLKNFNIPNLSFRSGAQTPTKISSAGNDRFTTNPLYDRLGDSFSIEMEAKSNPRIQEILKQYNLFENRSSATVLSIETKSPSGAKVSFRTTR